MMKIEGKEIEKRVQAGARFGTTSESPLMQLKLRWDRPMPLAKNKPSKYK